MRLRSYYVAPEVIVLFMAAATRHILIESDIPEDSILVAIVWDNKEQCFLITLYHETFAEIEDGQDIPVGDSPRVTRLDAFAYDREPRMN